MKTLTILAVIVIVTLKVIFGAVDALEETVVDSYKVQEVQQ